MESQAECAAPSRTPTAAARDHKGLANDERVRRGQESLNQKLSMPSARPGVRGLRPGRRASRHRRDSSSSWLALFVGLWAYFARTIPLPTGIQSRSHNHRHVVPDPPSSPNTSSYSGPDLGCNSYRLNFVGWMACARFEDPCSSHHSVFLYHLHREFVPTLQKKECHSMALSMP